VAAGENNGGGSQITLLGRGSGDRPVEASGISTPTPGREDGTPSECVPSWPLKSVLRIPVVLREQENEHGVSSDTPDVQLVETTPDPHSDTRGSDGGNETVVKQPPTAIPGGAYSSGVGPPGFITDLDPDIGVFRSVGSGN